MVVEGFLEPGYVPDDKESHVDNEDVRTSEGEEFPVILEEEERVEDSTDEDAGELTFVELQPAIL